MAGKHNKLNKCTPIESPAAYTANNNQRSESEVSSIPYHFTAAHIVSVVNMVDIAYTSPSTALNQIEVVKAVANPAARPAPQLTKVCSRVIVVSRPTIESLAKVIVIQATNAAASAVHAPDIRLTAKAIFSGL